MTDIILTYIIPALLAAVVSLFLGRKQGKNIQVDIEGKYKAMLDSEIESRRKDRKEYDLLEERVEKLEGELKRVWRAYDYSLRHIKKIDPNRPIPDFLNWDTGELMKYYREQFGE